MCVEFVTENCSQLSLLCIEERSLMWIELHSNLQNWIWLRNRATHGFEDLRKRLKDNQDSNLKTPDLLVA